MGEGAGALVGVILLALLVVLVVVALTVAVLLVPQARARIVDPVGK